MANSYEDLRASDGTGNAVLAHVDVDRLVGATVLKLDTVENFPNEFILVTGTVLPNTYIDADTQTEMRCHLSGTDVIIDSFEPGYADIGNTEGQIAIIKMTTGWANRVVELAKVSHNNDGSIKDGVIGPDSLNASAKLGWFNLGDAPDTVTPNGNRSYTLVYTGVNLTDKLMEGSRMKFSRSSLAPTQAIDLNGTTKYLSRTSTINGMTFLDDFTVSGWLYLTSYSSASIVSRFNGTSGWQVFLDSNGRLGISGYNGGSGNFSEVKSYQSIPLNRWVWFGAQLDMSAFTATSTTSYVMFDAVDVPAVVARGGTNPTALVQAGNLEIGGLNGGTNPFPGRIAQVSIYGAKVPQGTLANTMHQTITGAETNLVSGFTLNGVLTDAKVSNANNLTAQNSAGFITDSPFAGGSRSYDTAGEVEHGLVVTKPVYSGGNTTLTVQVPEGHALPIGASAISGSSYSNQAAPFGFVRDRGRWAVEAIGKITVTQSSPTAQQWYWSSTGAMTLNIPPGAWDAEMQGIVYGEGASASFLDPEVTLCLNNTSSTSSAGNISDFTSRVTTVVDTVVVTGYLLRSFINVLTSTPHYRKIRMVNAGRSTVGNYVTVSGQDHLRIIPAHL